MALENIQKPILLVEDNPIDLDLTLRAFALKNISNPIQVARDGEEALSYFERWENGEPKPIVILLDINMPKIDGLEVLKKLKEHPDFKIIPVVILTTSSESADLQKAYQLGVNSYIIKPISFENFLDVVGHIDLYWRLTNKPL
ncbi:response regulator [uncultured Flavobacterium sp.]|uniref:response regulator n=1 Tax=uncultured Flavobacterium sp. TaxID=165435 RepID=UPI0030ED2FDF